MENRKLIYGGVAAVVVLLLVVLLWPESSPEEPQTLVIEEPAIEKFVIPEPVEPEPLAEPEPELPILPLAPRVVEPPNSLGTSDTRAREAALDLSVQLGRWLMPAEQVRKWAVFIDRAADGDLQSKHRPWNIKLGAYIAGGSEASPRSTVENYQRYDRVVDVMDAIAVDKLAYYLEQWAVILDEAYQELGQGGNFRERLLMALDQVVAAEPLSLEAARLVQPSVMYKYADVRLESASDIQKLMWRMGPENAAKVQRLARELRNTLLSPPQYQSGF